MTHILVINKVNVPQISPEGKFDTFPSTISVGENFTFRSAIQIDEQINLPKKQVHLSDEFTFGEMLENEALEWKIQVAETLEGIRCEAENAYALNNEIDPVPVEAYDDASLLLDKLFDYDIPIPHIGWAEDGSIGLEWRPENGIVTMGIYGDNFVIYGIFFEENRQVDGVCSLSDTALLEGFVETLKRLL